MRPVEDGRTSPLEGWGPEARPLPQVPAGSAALETPPPRRRDVYRMYQLRQRGAQARPPQAAPL